MGRGGLPPAYTSTDAKLGNFFPKTQVPMYNNSSMMVPKPRDNMSRAMYHRPYHQRNNHVVWLPVVSPHNEISSGMHYVDSPLSCVHHVAPQSPSVELAYITSPPLSLENFAYTPAPPHLMSTPPNQVHYYTNNGLSQPVGLVSRTYAPYVFLETPCNYIQPVSQSGSCSSLSAHSSDVNDQFGGVGGISLQNGHVNYNPDNRYTNVDSTINEKFSMTPPYPHDQPSTWTTAHNNMISSDPYSNGLNPESPNLTNYRVLNHSQVSGMNDQQSKMSDGGMSYVREIAYDFIESFCPHLGNEPYCLPPVKRSRHPDKSSKLLVLSMESEKRVLGSFERFFSEHRMPVFMLCHYPIAGFMQVYSQQNPLPLSLRDQRAGVGHHSTVTLMLLSHLFDVTIVTVSIISGNSDFAYIQRAVMKSATHMKRCKSGISERLRFLGVRSEVREVLAFPNLKKAMLQRITKDKAFKQNYGNLCTLHVDDLSAPFQEEWSTPIHKVQFTEWMKSKVMCHRSAVLQLSELHLVVGALLSPRLSNVEYVKDVTMIHPITDSARQHDSNRGSTEDLGQLKLTIDGETRAFDEFMDEYVKCYYPDVETKSYRVPPIHFNIQSFKKPADYVKEKPLIQSAGHESDEGVPPLCEWDFMPHRASYKWHADKSAVGESTTEKTWNPTSAPAVGPSSPSQHKVNSSHNEHTFEKHQPKGDESETSTLEPRKTDKSETPNAAANSLNRMSRGQLNTKGKSMNGASRLALLKEFEVLADVMKKDTRADEGENRVISALEILSHRYGPMFIICGYQYNNYLNKLREEMFSKGEASRPVRAFGQTMRAEHDCLIFHKNYGAIIVCIKAIGDNFSDWNASEEDRISSTNKILGKAIKQLEREEAMIHHVTSDLMKLKCHKLIALPNMTRDDVMKALAKDQKLLKSINDLTNNLGADLFLCQDELSDKKVSIWDLPEEKTRRLARWWELVSGTLMSEADFIEAKVYRQIIGRYCGLLSTVEVWSPSNPRVEVRSISEAVDLCGKRFAKVVLLPHQVEVLCSNHKRLFLYGPPGSGKTLLLILKAREWLISGKTVILLNVRPGSIHGFPYAYGVFDRLKKMVAPFRVPITNLRMVNIDTLKFQSDALASVLPTWCVIMDEVTPAAHQVIEHLSCLQVQHIWCAGVFTDDRPITAHRFFACKMDKILRCPPIVQTVMKHTEEDVRLSKPYEQLYQSNSLHFSMEKQSLGSNRFSETDKENAKEKSILSVPQAKSCLTEREGNIKTICEEPDKCGKSGPDVVSSKSAVKFEEEELKYDPDLLNERLMSRYGRKSLSLQEKNLKEDELKMPQNLSWYSTSSVDLGLATDGPRPHIIDHQSHTQPGLPLDCPKCAEELAKFLLSMVKQDAFSSEKEPRSQPSKNKYAFKNTGGASSKGGRVGRETTIFSNASTIHMKTPSIMSFGSKLFDNKALTWSDVLIVANDVDQECPLVSGLRNRGIPVEVVRGSQAHKIETSRTPTLFVTTYKEVNGLERSLIIFVPSEVPDELHKKKETPDLLDLQLGHCIKRFTDKDRTALWYVASRSLSSLVLMLP